jgi:hypothetical protein
VGAAVAPCPECGYPTSAEICGVCRVRRALAGEGGGPGVGGDLDDRDD